MAEPSPSDPRIRAARSGDAAELARLSSQLGYPMTAPQAAAQFATLDGHADHALLVAEGEVALLGWLQVSLPRVFESPVTAEIAGLVVDEARRGAGIGAALVAAAAAWSRDRGCRGLRVRTNVVRERARRFYEREGFAPLKTQHVLELRLDEPS